MSENDREPADAPDAISIERMTVEDISRTRAAFAMMHEVFEEDAEDLSDTYLAALLGNDAFWAIAAFDGIDPVGCLTAHELPMTRHERIELFIYDLAVRDDQQRRGIGRRLVRTLIDSAADAGIDVVFVPADDEDTHALTFYENIGGRPAKVTIFDFVAGETVDETVDKDADPHRGT